MNVLLVKKVKKTDKKQENVFTIETNCKPVIKDATTKETTKQAKSDTKITDIPKIDDVAYQHLLALSDNKMTAVVNEINNSIYSIIKGLNYDFYNTVIIKNKIDYSKLEEYLNSIQANIPDGDIKQFDSELLHLATLNAYYKAIYNKGIEKTKKIKTVEIGDKEYHVDRYIRDYENKKTYMGTDNNYVENYRTYKSENDTRQVAEKYINRELHNNMELFTVYERLSINTFNNCYVKFLENLKENSTVSYDKENRMLPFFYNKENIHIQYRRLISSLAYKFNYFILRSASEGLKGNKTNKDNMQFISADKSINEGEDNTTLYNMLEDDKQTFDNFFLDYNLKEELNEKEYKILYLTYVGYTTKEICDTCKCSKTTIVKLKSKVAEIVLTTREINKSLDKLFTDKKETIGFYID
jgi:hypothetical protein